LAAAADYDVTTCIIRSSFVVFEKRDRSSHLGIGKGQGPYFRKFLGRS